MKLEENIEQPNTYPICVPINPIFNARSPQLKEFAKAKALEWSEREFAELDNLLEADKLPSFQDMFIKEAGRSITNDFMAKLGYLPELEDVKITYEGDKIIATAEMRV